MIASGAVKVHVGDQAKRILDEVGAHRLLSSLFVLTQPDDAEQKAAGVVKGRWVIRGYVVLTSENLTLQREPCRLRDLQ